MANHYKQGYKAIIAIGNNKIRRNIAEKYSLDYISLIHPNAVIANDVQIGAGTVVMAGAIINSGTIIGRHCIINSGAGGVVIQSIRQKGTYVGIPVKNIKL